MQNVPAKPSSGADWNTYGAALDAALRELQGTGANPLGWIAVDAFGDANASDDARLSLAMQYASQQTQKPVLRLSARRYKFLTALGLPYDGFVLRGAGLGQLDVYSSTRATNHTTVEIACGTPWLELTPAASTTSWGGYVGGINFLTNGATQVFARAGYPSQFRIWTFEDLAFQGFYGVFGDGASEQFASTICNFVGSWYIANCRGTGVGLRGSDSIAVWPYGIDFYQSGVYGDGGNKFSIVLNAQGKTNISRVYLTCFGGYRGVKITGSRSNGMLVLDKWIVEGDKVAAASGCNGNLIRVGDGSTSGGLVTLRDMRVDCGMVNPAGTASANANGQADRALVEIMGAGTDVTIDGINFAHSVGIDPATMPCIRVSNGARARIRNLSWFQRDGGGTAWGSNMPRVEQSTGGLITDWDSTVVCDPATNQPYVVA